MCSQASEIYIVFYYVTKLHFASIVVQGIMYSEWMSGYVNWIPPG